MRTSIIGLVMPQQPFDRGGGHNGADSMLGISFIPQHSAARVLLEQVIYRWRNSLRTLAPILRDGDRLLVPAGCWGVGA